MPTALYNNMTNFIKPEENPCGPDCESYNENNQCPKCGWLKPMNKDALHSFREAPLGPAQPCSLDTKTVSREVIESIIPFMWPGGNRGPANKKWVKVMKMIANEMGWEVCSKCNGDCVVPVISDFRNEDVCTSCLGIGKVCPDDNLAY